MCFVMAGLIFHLLTTLLLTHPTTQTNTNPNVLFIVADDLGEVRGAGGAG